MIVYLSVAKETPMTIKKISTHKDMIIIHYILSFGPPKERIKEKLSGCNKTAKNLLVAASFDNRGALFFVAATELGESYFSTSKLCYRQTPHFVRQTVSSKQLLVRFY
jgi:hypothetical protein